MCETHYGGIKGVDTRTRKELKTTPRFSFSVTRKPNALPLPALKISRGERDRPGGEGQVEANSTSACQIQDAGGHLCEDV